MASLCRFQKVSAVRKILPSCTPLRTVQVCRISTSDKKLDGADVKTPEISHSKSNNSVPKQWASWGFDDKDYETDRNMANATFFWGVSVALCGSAFILAYYPDMNKHEWYLREAYLELRRREEAGLPPIDPNYVPPSQVVLPTDEELGDFEIII